MRFFIEFLNNFSVIDLLKMFAEGAFRSSDEIKMADYTINYKVVFNDEFIDDENLKIYKHLQRVVEAVRAQPKNFTNKIDEQYRCYSVTPTHFNHFILFGENERELTQLSIIERRIIFSFIRRDTETTIHAWIRGALCELINYVLMEHTDTDRVGIVIKHEQHRDRKATFPIRPKAQLMASFIQDTLNSVLRIKGNVVCQEKLALQVVRIRMPQQYRQLNQEHLPALDDNEYFDYFFNK